MSTADLPNSEEVTSQAPAEVENPVPTNNAHPPKSPPDPGFRWMTEGEQGCV
jgi:hypothetical protein